MDDNDRFVLPINVGNECQILMHNNDQLRRCQTAAYDQWIRPSMQFDFSYLVEHHPHEHRHNRLSNRDSCCYRWSLLDCLAECVQEYCPRASTFDMRVFLTKRDQVVQYYESFQCESYPFGSLSCHLTNWTWTFIFIGLAILFMVTLGLIWFNIRFHRNSEQMKDENDSNNVNHNVTDL